MKQHLTEINGRPLLFVELPKNTVKVGIDGRYLWYYHQDIDDVCGNIIIPQGNWQLYGSPFSLSEKQVKELVEEIKPCHFKDYTANWYTYDNGLQSWQSFLENEKVFDKNPFSDPCSHNSNCQNYCQGSCWNSIDYTYEEFEEVEKRVFKNALLLIDKL